MVDSTQTVVRDAAQRGDAEGLVVVAGQQTAGKGRLGRDWWSPAEGGLYVSLLLRPRIAPDKLAWLTMIVSLSAVEAIETVCGVAPDLKWPNDLTWQGRKLAGVLAEASFADGEVSYVIAGIGLNLEMDFSQRPDLAQRAVSLHEITGQPVPVEAAAAGAAGAHRSALFRAARRNQPAAALGGAAEQPGPDGHRHHHRRRNAGRRGRRSGGGRPAGAAPGRRLRAGSQRRRRHPGVAHPVGGRGMSVELNWHEGEESGDVQWQQSGDARGR